MSLLLPPEIAALNDVIVAARDCRQVLIDSAERLRDGPMKAALENRAAERDEIIEALSAVVRDRGELPPADSGPDEQRLAGEFWSDVVARVVGDREAPLRELCLKAESTLLAAIDSAQREDLPEMAKRTLAKFGGRNAESSLDLPTAS